MTFASDEGGFTIANLPCCGFTNLSNLTDRKVRNQRKGGQHVPSIKLITPTTKRWQFNLNRPTRRQRETKLGCRSYPILLPPLSKRRRKEPFFVSCFSQAARLVLQMGLRECKEGDMFLKGTRLHYACARRTNNENARQRYATRSDDGT